MILEEWNALIGEEEVAKYKDLKEPVVVEYSAETGNDVLLRLKDDLQSEDDEVQEKAVNVLTTLYQICRQVIRPEIIQSYFNFDCMLVLYDGPGPNVAGFAILDLNYSDTKVSLQLVCSEKTAKGKNYGKMLIAKAEEVARRYDGVDTLRLSAADGVLAKKVYEPLGFKVTGKDGPEFLMEKSLAPAPAPAPASAPAPAPAAAGQGQSGTSRRKRKTRKTRRAKKVSRTRRQ
jgi:ribosomal protein S18 acetylase RimI-like enzyme